MSGWTALVSTAVVGTQRRPVPEALEAEVAAVLGDAPEGAAGDGLASAEARVLTAAAVLGTWRRAGWSAAVVRAPLPPAAPADDRPLPSATAVGLLELLLDARVPVSGGPTAVVAEWLQRCAAAGRRLPAPLLPRVLEAATAQPLLRAGALAAGGPVLRWLGGRHERWAWAGSDAGPGPAPAQADGEPVEQVWATGERSRRLGALERLRAADPGAARALLSRTWTREAAADRARFVEALAVGLSPDDEPFLEAALDDRSAAVRAAAAVLLSRLPGSAYAARMADRLRPLVTVTGRVRKRLEVALGDPAVLGAPAAVRDGIAPTGGTGRPLGRGGRLLVGLVAATPLALWTELVGSPPADVVGLGAAHDELVTGWVLAATRQHDVEWARALLRLRREPALLAVLPPALAQAELPGVLRAADDAALAALVGAVPGPWSPATSAAVVARLRAATSASAVVQALPAAAVALAPEVATEVDAWVGSLPPTDARSRAVRTLGSTLSIRRTLAQELA